MSMKIAWKYLDKKAAALAALKDYQNQQDVLEHTEPRIKELEDDLTAIHSVDLSFHSKTNDPHRRETEIASTLDREGDLREKYRAAKQYMAWFQPAWDFLTETDKTLLKAFYLKDKKELTKSAEEEVARELSIEHATIYKRKNLALEHLAVLLFGSSR